ncbi:MFS transporter [Microbacterium sp. X-17]|uniref:MFS transporter n=1 Tax=Microbacterium sp. X-17 TaxID=3144404 RepID=UPI0031F4C836
MTDAAGGGPGARRGAPLVFGAGLAQGLVLVCFPAAASVLTSPAGYALSATQYGFMFAPQVVLAIAGAALTPVLARRWSLRGVLGLGLAANLAAMLLMVASLGVAPSALAYVLLLAATGCLGVGFGTCVSSLSQFAAALKAGAENRNVLVLNVMLGLGTALAPVLVALLLPDWWILPLLVSAGLVVLLVATARVRLDPGAPAPAAGAAAPRPRLPRRFWWYVAAVVLYGVCETLFGNWSTLYLSGERQLPTAVASAALAAFWACVTLGRVIVAILPARIPVPAVYVVLPFLIAGASLAVASASTSVAAVLAYAAAGLACSAMLPLSVSFGEREFARWGSTSSGELIAGYQVGYGIAAFGAAPLLAATGLPLGAVYVVGAIAALALAVTALTISRGRALRAAPFLTTGTKES